MEIDHFLNKYDTLLLLLSIHRVSVSGLDTTVHYAVSDYLTQVKMCARHVFNPKVLPHSIEKCVEIYMSYVFNPKVPF